MKKIFAAAAMLLGITASMPAQQLPKPLVTGLSFATGVAVGPGGKIYVSCAGKTREDGFGSIVVIDKEKTVPFVTRLNNPMKLVAFQQWLYVIDRDRVLRVDANGKVEIVLKANEFPSKSFGFTDLAVDQESGVLYVSDFGDPDGKSAAIRRISPKGKVDTVIDAKRFPGLFPMGVVMDGASHLLFSNRNSGELYRVKLADGSTEKLGEIGKCIGLICDHHGRLFFSDIAERVFTVPRPGAEPILLADGFKGAGYIGLDSTGRNILVPDYISNSLYSIPINIPGWEVDETPLPLKPAVAFPDLQWTGWEPETKSGKPNPLRPIVLTHAGDGSNRVFVATEQGVIHAFPNEQKATKTNVFLDLTDRVSYRDDQNEEGFLGLCFHPKYKQNGEFFVFYTPKKTKGVNVLSRFRVSKDNPDRADPNSEEELMRFKKPFWNHDGGTVCFGPDGYLYVTHGDGGAANDPFENGQNLNSLLGKIHRIDVDHKDAGKNYAIPKDNPFAGRKDAIGEIWSYGHRNVWRMAFDRKTGKLWAGDVGQNLFEEIDIIEKGGNYGWNRREGLHPFGPKGEGPSKKFIDPIWEYHHDVGKSITGGGIYRGPRLSELDGMYLYGDYVSNKIWALKYDQAKGRVVANRPIKDLGMPMFSFGEDEKGEMYMLCPATTGKGIFWFVRQ